MKKRIFAILLTLCILLGTAPAAFATEETNGTCGENLTWTLKDGVLTISGKGPMKEYALEDEVFPWQTLGQSIREIQIGNDVTSIAEQSFSGCEDLTAVTIPDSVTRIGPSAFYECKHLASVTIPSKVEYIADYAFSDCESLKQLTISDGVFRIGNFAFRNCKSLTAVTIPGSAKLGGDAAFQGCTSLSRVIIAEGVTGIGSGAFGYCEALTSVTLPKSIQTIEKDAFVISYNVVWENEVPKTVYTHPKELKICGYTGTAAETYAKEQNIHFIPLDSSNFTDVQNTSAWYYDAVQWAVKSGITTGMTETTFAPESNCTRAQAVTFLWRAAGKPEPKSTGNPFTDVADTKDTNWYYKAVLWAVEQGITTGTTAATFSPDETCNRAQIVTFLYRHAGKPAANGGTFSDVTADQYYYQAVQWATANEITNGMGDGKFAPETDCSRGHIVTFLYRDLAK